MQGQASWLWKALLVAACIGYQLLVHAWIAEGASGPLRASVAFLPLLVLAGWVARYAAHKFAWSLGLISAAVVLYAIEQTAAAGVAVAYGMPHAAINLFLLWFFGRTLVHGREPLITGFARRFHGSLAPHMELYTRRVTAAWCVFFVLQLVVSAALFRWAPIETWSLFVNLLSFPLVLVMFLVEYAYRITRYRNYPHASILEGVRMFAKRTRVSRNAEVR